jgi:uncharacterized protein (TIGR00661 family)
MDILYGVVGEGMGHATRSRVILEHLVERHEVRIVVSGRAHAYLSKRFPDAVEIQGLHMAYEANAVDRSRTAWELLNGLPSMLSRNVEEFLRMSEGFAPDAVVSDFESFAYAFGKLHDLPVISIDNMQVLDRCALDVEIPEAYAQDFRLAKAVVKGKLPGCHHYLVTSFFFPPVRKERTTLFPPILRDEILRASPSRGDHLLVYQTSTTNDELLRVLREAGVPCRVYGFRRSERLGNVELRDFSEEGFVEDLASCRGVLASGGFSLMGEAVYLGKPLLAVPVRKQFEQVLNALYLRKLGYGEHHEALGPETVRAFVGRLDGYAENLARHRQDGNTLILAALDRLLAEIARGAAAP